MELILFLMLLPFLVGITLLTLIFPIALTILLGTAFHLYFIPPFLLFLKVIIVEILLIKFLNYPKNTSVKKRIVFYAIANVVINIGSVLVLIALAI